MNYKECCYTGEYALKDLKKEGVDKSLDLKLESGKFTYWVKGMSPDLSQEKVRDLVKMYDRFIDPDLRPEWLPVSKPKIDTHIADFSPSSDLARQHRAALRKGKSSKKGLK